MASAGDENKKLAVVAVHRGVHILGLPEQFVLPAASNAYGLLSPEPTYTTPLATAGDDATGQRDPRQGGTRRDT